MSILNEIFDADSTGSHQRLNERPYSRGRESLDNMKGKVKGMFGSGQVEQGAADSGRLANKLWNDFKRAIGRKYGVAQSSVPYNDVKAFFDQNELDTSVLGNNTRMYFTPKDVGQAILAAARNYNNSLGADEPRKQPKPAQEEPQKEQQPSEQPAASSEKQAALSPLKGQLSALSSEDREKLLRMLS